jgi:hypothetical protein
MQQPQNDGHAAHGAGEQQQERQAADEEARAAADGPRLEQRRALAEAGGHGARLADWEMQDNRLACARSIPKGARSGFNWLPAFGDPVAVFRTSHENQLVWCT